MICFLFFSCIVLTLCLIATLNYLKYKNKSNKLKIAFFHPFCNDGGGGQKVLWCMIQAILKLKQSQTQPIEIAVYSLFENTTQMLNKVKTRFSIDLLQYQEKINIIYVSGRSLLTPKSKLTMILHIILPKIYALKCLFRYQPDIFYDTTGFASTLFLSKILLPTTKTIAYVHYPFISLDMIQKVKDRKVDFNNDSSISGSPFKSKLKLIYYQIILFSYKLNGWFVDQAQTNSSWTHNHMKQIWTALDKKQFYLLSSRQKLIKLYPPCSVSDLTKFSKKPDSKDLVMMSLAQFRPEKNHKLQIRVAKRLIDQISKLKSYYYLDSQKIDVNLRLFICGTTRGQDDEKILQDLRKQVTNLGMQKNVEFKVNKPFSNILEYLELSLIGIHSMQAQHFGISVVEMLAAGLIVVAHNSAGPKQDIIKDNRYLAVDEQDYYHKILNVIKLSTSEKENIIKANRVKAHQFGEQAFKKQFIKCLNLTNKSKNVKND